MTIGDNTFNFTYKVDRIDRINDKGELRIIDYKTGKDNVKFKNIGDVVSNKDSGHYLAIMQLFLYCYALKNDANITNFDVSVGLQPIIYKIKDMGTSGITHDKNMITNLFSDENSGIYNEFLSEMAGVINDFFDKKCHSRNAKMIRKQNVSIVDSLSFAEDNDLIFCIFQKKQ